MIKYPKCGMEMTYVRTSADVEVEREGIVHIYAAASYKCKGCKTEADIYHDQKVILE